jgi:hypothetical protein
MIQGDLIKGTLFLAIFSTLYIPIAFVFTIEHPEFPMRKDFAQPPLNSRLNQHEKSFQMNLV